jgi:hypothetical protein
MASCESPGITFGRADGSLFIVPLSLFPDGDSTARQSHPSMCIVAG